MRTARSTPLALVSVWHAECFEWLRRHDPRDYTHDNPVRIESATQAAVIDEAIAVAWQKHPRVEIVESRVSFLDKAAAALAIVRARVPSCCA